MNLPRILGLAFLLICGQALAVDHPLPPVRWGAEQNRVRVTLIDQDAPDRCAFPAVTPAQAPDITIILSTDNGTGAFDTFTAAELNTITAFGTWQSMDTSIPGAIPFGQVPGVPCQYELHLPNTIFDVAGAKRIYITIHDVNSGTNLAGEITSDTWYIDLNTTDLNEMWNYGFQKSCEEYDTLNSMGERLCNPHVDAIYTAVTATLPAALTALNASVSAVAETVWTSGIETAGETVINARCAFTVVLATLQGTWVAGETETTFTDPSGTEPRVTQTTLPDHSAKTAVEIMCGT